MSSRVDVRMPADQSEGTESYVATWFKATGDQVTENEPLLEISTDKVNVEVAAPAGGRLAEILRNEGEQIQPGEVLGRIDTGASDSPGVTRESAAAAVSATPQADGSGKIRSGQSGAPSTGSADLSPAVRKLLGEHNLDASQIRGTGKGGRITHQDVLAFIESGSVVTTTRKIPSRRVPHTQMRKSIAQHMVQSVQTAPHVTSVFEADLSAVITHRDAHKAELESRGVKLTYTAYFVQAAVAALQAVPEANSRWHDDALELYDDCNIGIATALEDGGLIVPVIHRAQELDLSGIAQRLYELTEKARGGKLDPRDVQNGTFTLSNHGVSGSLVAAPIVIVQPQSAILGVGKVERRAVVSETGEVIVRPMAYVTLTIDHRVLDGYRANQFLTRFVERLEE